MQLSLYRAERPEVFEDIIGQKQIVRILQNQIKNNSVSQAYLFTGTHGTGKTSTARILAKAVNCEKREQSLDGSGIPCGECENCRAIKEGRFVDVIELDAASNNKVEDLRSLIELVKYPPTIGKYKVFIIDEVHMLTVQAENAFLKTLEEPPEYAIFILATTDPQKVKDTIKSRCMQLNFKRVSEADLIDGMGRICTRNGVEATQDALGTIARQANGSVRDALSILDQCMAAGDSYIDKSLVLEYTCTAGEDFFIELTDCVIDGRIGDAIVCIGEAVSNGKDARQLLKDWLEHYRNLLVCRYVDKAEGLVGASSENTKRLKDQAMSVGTSDIDRAIRMLSEYINLARYSDRPRILVETAAVRLAGETAEEPAQRSTVKAKPVSFDSTRPRQAVKKSPEPEEKLEVETETARTNDADPAAMWRNIVASISRTDMSFETLVGKNSRGDSYSNDELLITVKKTKIGFAEDLMNEIRATAQSLYGANITVTLRPGDVKSVQSAIKTSTPQHIDPDPIPEIPPAAMSPEELAQFDTEAIVEEDIAFDEMVSDIESVLGVSSVDIID